MINEMKAVRQNSIPTFFRVKPPISGVISSKDFIEQKSNIAVTILKNAAIIVACLRPVRTNITDTVISAAVAEPSVLAE